MIKENDFVIVLEKGSKFYGEIGRVIEIADNEATVKLRCDPTIRRYFIQDLVLSNDFNPQLERLIDRFLQLYNEYCHIPSIQLKEFPTAKDYILNKLNDEEENLR